MQPPRIPARHSCLTRRTWLGASAAAAAAACWPWTNATAAEPPAGCTLSIGTYSLKGMELPQAVALLVEIGYDAIEIATQPGFPGEPTKLNAEARAALRRQLSETGLKLRSLMEHLMPSADAASHQADLARLGRVMDLANELAVGPPPLVQTVLGGGDWNDKKTLFRDRLGDWLRLAQSRRIVLAIKPHRGGALSRPEEAIWLIRQLGDSPWLRMVYDYSHYAFRDMPLDATIREALPYTAHIAVKGAVQRKGKVDFVLPGDGDGFDYAGLLRQFYAGGYRGDVCVEVSSMVSKQPGYNPAAAARTSYRNMAKAFADAGVPRLGRKPS